MPVTIRGLLAITCLLAACTSSLEGGDTPDPIPFPEPDHPIGLISVTLDRLQPGWRVTTSRLGLHVPDERTIVSDGSPIQLIGSGPDVFIATVTDAAGTLVAMHAMMAPCTLASGRRLDVPGDYPTIQGAIDEADPGDTVWVAAGTYTESVQLRPGVCLLGSGARRSILDAGGEGRTLVDLTDAPGSVVAGFTLRGVTRKPGCETPDPFACSGDRYTAGVYLGPVDIRAWEDPTLHAPPIIANNVFEGNDIGVMLYHHGITVVRNNVFAQNRIGLVANHYEDRTLVANNVFDGNTELAIGNQTADLDIIDNIIVRSQLGIRFDHLHIPGHIACNLFFGNGANANEAWVQIGRDGNLEVEPKFVGGGDYRLQLDSPGKDKGCHKSRVFEPDGSLPDIGAFGGPLAAWADL